MRTRRVARALLLALSLAGLIGACGVHHSWAWKEADLDRNRLNLALSRGADTGPDLAGWVEHGTVEEAVGDVTIGGDNDVVLRVRYEWAHTDWLGSASENRACYEFTSPDGYDVEFSPTPCQDWR